MGGRVAKCLVMDRLVFCRAFVAICMPTFVSTLNESANAVRSYDVLPHMCDLHTVLLDRCRTPIWS